MTTRVTTLPRHVKHARHVLAAYATVRLFREPVLVSIAQTLTAILNLNNIQVACIDISSSDTNSYFKLKQIRPYSTLAFDHVNSLFLTVPKGHEKLTLEI